MKIAIAIVITTSVYVTVTLRSNSDDYEIESISLDTEAMDCGAVSYSAIVPSTFALSDFELTAGDGSKTVFACLKDRAGLTTQVSNTIICQVQSFERR